MLIPFDKAFMNGQSVAEISNAKRSYDPPARALGPLGLTVNMLVLIIMREALGIISNHCCIRKQVLKKQVRPSFGPVFSGESPVFRSCACYDTLGRDLS